MEISATFYKHGENYGGHKADQDLIEVTIGSKCRTITLVEFKADQHHSTLKDLDGYSDLESQVSRVILEAIQ